MNEIPAGTNVIGHLLRKGARFAHQAATTLAQGGIETLDMIGLPTRFSHGTMALGGQTGCVRFPKIGGTDGTLAIDGWQRGPPFARGRFAPRPNRHAHTCTRFATYCQPDPLLAPLLADKRPPFIAFQNQRPFFCAVTVTERGTAAYLALT